MNPGSIEGSRLIDGRTAVRTARLVSGLVLALFLFTHFCNLAFGLISTGAMEASRPALTGLWSNPAGMFLLYGALLIHICLTLQAVYNRHTLTMSLREAVQLSLGLLFPFLLVAHVVSTEVVPVLTGHRLSFAQEVDSLWIVNPWMGGRQLFALAVGWFHACLGVWFWLRPKRWFGRAAPVALAGAIVVPLLAVVGFIEAGKEVTRLPPQLWSLEPWMQIRATTISVALYTGLTAVIAAVLAARQLRASLQRRSKIHVQYPDGRVVVVPSGYSILEVSRSARISHLSVCGGRGRCSTCRVRVLAHLQEQPAAEPLEQATLDRIKAEPNVRLACQLRPTHNLAIMPILAASAHPLRSEKLTGILASAGTERLLAILFCDLRGFTRRSEHLLPYDTVFVLNQYFQVIGDAVESSGGYVDKFIGDGALALFGLNDEPDAASRQALQAAARISRGIDELNHRMGDEFKEPLRIAMGLHFGPAVVGEMGYGRTTALTAIGDGINVASRLESLAKQHDAELVASLDLLTNAGASSSSNLQTVALSGRVDPVTVMMFRKHLYQDRDFQTLVLTANNNSREK